jgi:hypothetical protein
VVDQPVNLTPGPQVFSLDIDGDSNIEFQFSAIRVKGGGNTEAVVANPVEAGSNWIIASGTDPQQLAANDLIDAGGTFGGGAFSFIVGDGGAGEWNSPFPDPGFMGVSFDLAGSTHYGWVEITATGGSSVILNQWAYEDVAGTGIRAGDTGSVAVPEPGTAMLMAAVAGGMLIQRFKRRLKQAS